MLTDCITNDAKISELFILEAGHWSTMAKDLRDRNTQAVLPLAKSICNVNEASLDALMDDEQVKNTIMSLGVGIRFQEIQGGALNLAPLRYHKIIIATEDSPTGRHIRTQVVTFFHLYNQPLIGAGHVYVADAKGTKEQFEANVMHPATRHIIQLRAGPTLAETLKQIK